MELLDFGVDSTIVDDIYDAIVGGICGIAGRLGAIGGINDDRRGRFCFDDVIRAGIISIARSGGMIKSFPLLPINPQLA